jgi:hypothetical protein
MAGTSVPLQDFLALFGVRVRNHSNVARIATALAEAELASVPSFATCPPGAELHLRKTAAVTDTAVEPDDDEDEDLPAAVLPHRPLQVGDLPCARAGLRSVSPDIDLASATMLMRTHNYSQLPVIDGTSHLHGVLTWSSFARHLETGKMPTLATAMVTDPPVAQASHQLLTHLPAIAEHGYVLVRASDGTFCGVVTGADVSGCYETMARPFFLVGDIEARLRRCLEVLDEDAIRAVQLPKRKTGRIVDLMFGQYQRLLDNEVNWARIGWTGVPHQQFVHKLDRVRRIRNEIAHFRPDPLTMDARATLEEFAGLLKQYVP